ncbi:MAG: Gfo/Idh/MocA family oxidoreductase [Cyclobacteriaceae bacterium]
MINTLNRRNFVKTSVASGVGLSVLSVPNILFGQDDRKVNLGFIGVGMRGRNHVRVAGARPDVNIKAICDIDPASIEAAQKLLREAGHTDAEAYTNGEYDYLRMLERDDLDAVIIATPWLWHTRMAVAAMKAGKFAGVEVSAANTLEECWDLVNVHEETKTPVMILENVCYRRDVMAVLNMVRDGLFGELIHLECGYQHDLRNVKFNNGKDPYGGGVEFGEKGFSEAKWRTNHSVHRNGDIYPTHGIGPVANMININRGNRFDTITSVASKSRGLHKYIVDNGGEDHPNAKVEFKLGDVVTSLIKTVNGETIMVQHDTNSPRPYSLGFRVQGTQGIWMDLNQSLLIEGKTPEHEWTSDAEYMKEYDHPLWQKYGEQANGAGHGGMDFFLIHCFVEAVKNNEPAPIDAYDAAAWSSITPLSEQSIALGGETMEFPDFTRGQWMKRKPQFALSTT